LAGYRRHRFLVEVREQRGNRAADGHNCGRSKGTFSLCPFIRVDALDVRLDQR